MLPMFQSEDRKDISKRAKDRLKIVVVMPTYNEAKNISRMIDVLWTKIFPRIENAEIYLLIVDDESPDGTGAIVKNKMKRYPNLHLSIGRRKGLGMAYVRGFRYAMGELKADAVIEMDADFQHDPSYLKKMVDAFMKGADYVIGSRFVEGGSIPKGWLWHRRVLSKMGNAYARLILGMPDVHDLTTGFRLTRVKGVLDQIDIDNLMALDRFAYKIDLLCQTVAISKIVIEVPIRFMERKDEESKFNLLEVICTYIVVMRLRGKQLFGGHKKRSEAQ